MSVQLLIPAAGMGTRLGHDCPKALVSIAGKPLVVRTLERFVSLGLADRAVITIPPEHRAAFETTLAPQVEAYQVRLVDGGAERQDSVANGLAALEPDTEIVAIHDAARPFITAESVQASIDAARECGAATVAIPSVDTILQGDKDAFLQSTPDRSLLWACQTPQTFRVEVIRDAHAHASAGDFIGTDDATLVRRMGGTVKLVHGTRLNLKITTPEDLQLAQQIIAGDLA